MKFDFNGVISALVTPFSGGQVDLKSLARLVEFQLERGIQGFVINGTTGESPTLTQQEVIEIFKTVENVSQRKVPLILGTGSNSTIQTIENSRLAEKLNADAMLVVVPYYNKPPQRGLVAHFNSVAAAATCPVILYNVPGRTIAALTEESILELADNKNIIGIKEASGNIDFDRQLIEKSPKNFVFLSGDDGTFLQFLECGGHGIISVMSNLITGECIDWMYGKNLNKNEIFEKYLPLINAMYVEANPIPLKWMLWKKGLIASPELRLPMMTLSPNYFESTTILMKELKLI